MPVDTPCLAWPTTLPKCRTSASADKFLEAFVAALTPLRAFSTDFSPEFTQRGKTVNVPVDWSGECQLRLCRELFPRTLTAAWTASPWFWTGTRCSRCTLTDKEVSESSWVSIERLAVSKARQLAPRRADGHLEPHHGGELWAAALDPVDAEDFNADTGARRAPSHVPRRTCPSPTARARSRQRLLTLISSATRRISHSYLMQMSQPLPHGGADSAGLWVRHLRDDHSAGQQ